jgi:hypothetical protein
MISVLRPQPSRGTPWLITFVDLVGLLLAFFVMQFAMTSVDRARLQDLFGTANADGPPIAADRADRDAILGAEMLAELADPGYLAAVLRQRFEAAGAREATVMATGSGVRIDLDRGAAFAALSPVLDLLRRLPVQLAIRVAVPDPASDLDWRTALESGERLAADLAAAGIGRAVEHAAAVEPDAAPIALLVAKFDGVAP